MIEDIPSWAPIDVDVSKPSAARVYDYLLGGAHNFEVDRVLARRVCELEPAARDIAIRNRAFLRRVVRYLVHNGIRQFLDLGSGIPTVGNVHEIAQSMAPDTRVVYVDYEKVAYSHSQLLLRDNKNVGAVLADAIRVDDVLNAPVTRELLDFDQPVGILGVTLGHYVPAESDPGGMFARYRDAVVPGSYLGLAHLTDDFEAEGTDRIVAEMRQNRDHLYPRTREAIMAFFGDFELVEPGLVTTSQWHPDDGLTAAVDPREDAQWAGVGRKP